MRGVGIGQCFVRGLGVGLLALLACGKSAPKVVTPPGKTYTFYWIVKDQSNETYTAGAQGAPAAAAALTQKGPDTVKVVVSGENPQSSSATAAATAEAGFINAAVTAKADGIILTSDDDPKDSSGSQTTAIQTAMNAATAAGIPIMTFDSDENLTTSRFGYYSVNSFDAANAAITTAFTSPTLKGVTGGKYAIVTGSLTSATLNNRVLGFQSVMSGKAPNWTCMDNNPGCLHNAGAPNLAATPPLISDGCVSGVATNSDSSANTPCIGANGTPFNCFVGGTLAPTGYCPGGGDQAAGDVAALMEFLVAQNPPPNLILMTGAFPFRCTGVGTPAGSHCAANFLDAMPAVKAAAAAKNVAIVIVSGTEEEEVAMQNATGSVDGTPLVEVVAAQPLWNYGFETVNIMYNYVKTGTATPAPDATGFIDAGFSMVCPNNVDEAIAQWTSKNFSTTLTKCDVSSY